MNQDLTYELVEFMPQAVASGMFASVGTVQVPDGNYSDNGTPSGEYVDVAGLVDLPCQVDAVSGQTIKTIPNQLAIYLVRIVFTTYLPDIETAWRAGGRIVVDGVIYPNTGILAVLSDAEHLSTWAEARTTTL